MWFCNSIRKRKSLKSAEFYKISSRSVQILVYVWITLFPSTELYKTKRTLIVLSDMVGKTLRLSSDHLLVRIQVKGINSYWSSLEAGGCTCRQLCTGVYIPRDLTHTTTTPLILMIQVASLGVTWCNHLLTAGLASKTQVTLQPDPTAQLFYRLLVITEKKRGRRGEGAESNSQSSHQASETSR